MSVTSMRAVPVAVVSFDLYLLAVFHSFFLLLVQLADLVYFSSFILAACFLFLCTFFSFLSFHFLLLNLQLLFDRLQLPRLSPYLILTHSQDDSTAPRLLEGEVRMVFLASACSKLQEKWSI